MCVLRERAFFTLECVFHARMTFSRAHALCTRACIFQVRVRFSRTRAFFTRPAVERERGSESGRKREHAVEVVSNLDRKMDLACACAFFVFHALMRFPRAHAFFSRSCVFLRAHKVCTLSYILHALVHFSRAHKV